MKEEWREIKGYESIYQVSSLGRVRSLDRPMASGNGGIRLKKGRVLKSYPHKDGYCFVKLCHKTQKETSIHRLVASVFLERKDYQTEVNHKNGIRGDNRMDNLEWVSPKENVGHATLTLREGRHSVAKLTVNQVAEIIRLYKEGYATRKIAETFNVTQKSIYRIKSGQTWKHLLGLEFDPQ